MKMTLTDIFLDVENRRNLLSKEIDDYLYWAYNRYAIYETYRRKEKGHTIAHESLPGRKQIWRYLKNIHGYLKGKRHLAKFKKQQEKSMIVLAHPRRYFLDGEYCSIYTDLIIPDEWNVLTFEKTDLFTHHQPAMSKNLVYLDNIELKSKFSYLLHKFIIRTSYKRFESRLKDKVTPVLTELTNLTGIEVDHEAIIRTMASHYYVVKEALKYWQRIFLKGKISTIVEVVGYDLYIMAANQMAKEFKIPVVEIQHGMLSSIHIAYQYHIHSSPILTPDYIYTFSDYWSKEINIPNTKTIPIGFEFFNQQRNLHEKQKDHGNITIISQGNVGKLISKIALEVADEIKKQNKNIIVYYKLHPGEYNSAKEWYPGLFVHDVIKVISNEMNIYDLFAMSCVQIGYNSTALFEGMGYNLKTYLIEDGDPFMQKLITENVALNYESAKIVVDSIGDSIDIDMENIIWTSDTKNKFANAIALIQ